MNILHRISLVLRGYFAGASERMESVAAEEELRETRARKEAIAEIQSLDIPSILTSTSTLKKVEQANPLAPDYHLLGLNAGADLQAVEAAWRSLASRADPKRFPAGSDEEKRAGELLGQINGAYKRIRETLNPVEGRFGQLEL